MLMTAAVWKWVTGTAEEGSLRLELFFSQFANNRQGVIGIVFALALVPILSAAGASVDLSRAYLVKQRLSAALDAAGLAVGRSSETDKSKLEKIMKDYFNANYSAEKTGVAATPILTIKDGEVTISIEAKIDTAILQFAGIDEITVAESTTIVKESTGLEVVLVLDNTGSMRGSRLRDLKSAANKFVDIVFGKETEPELLKVGIVPFSTNVNIGTNKQFARNFTTQTPDDDAYRDKSGNFGEWEGCVEARREPFDTTDDTVGRGGKWKRYFYPDTSELFKDLVISGFKIFDFTENINNYNNRSRSQERNTGPNKACAVELLPLTNKKRLVLNKITQMVANGFTHINLGAVWGWRVLSPTPPFTGGVAYNDEEFNKAIVIMTDGSNAIQGFSGIFKRGSPHYGGYGPFSDNQLGIDRTVFARQILDRRLLTVCKNMKDKKILVYTITFGFISQGVKNTMRNCADEGRFFESPSGSALENAFRSIGTELKNLRIAK